MYDLTLFTKRSAIKCLLLLPVLLASSVFAAYSSAYTINTEERLKAALVYKMGLYVSWQNKPVKINYCFVGKDTKSISEILTNTINRKKLSNKVTVDYISNTDTIEKSNCQIIYIGDTDKPIETSELLSWSKSSLTITNSSTELNKGYISSIEFTSNKPKLAVSEHNLKMSDITISTNLLSAVTLIK